MRNQKGITLVALVITIIVLLILAGVSISLVIGNNGVLTQASNSVVTNNVADVKEDLTMALAAAETKYYTLWAQNSATTRTSVYEDRAADASANPPITAAEGAVVAELKGKYYVKIANAAVTDINNKATTAAVAAGSLVKSTEIAESATSDTVYVVLTKKGTDETYSFNLKKQGVYEGTGSYTIDPLVTYVKGTHSYTVNV